MINKEILFNEYNNVLFLIRSNQSIVTSEVLALDIFTNGTWVGSDNTVKLIFETERFAKKVSILFQK